MATKGTTNFDTVQADSVVAAITGNVTGQLVYPVVARTATTTGATTGTIAAAGGIQFVTVTATDANHIIVLPTPTPGTIVILRNGATGYELRTSARPPSPSTAARKLMLNRQSPPPQWLWLFAQPPRPGRLLAL